MRRRVSRFAFDFCDSTWWVVHQILRFIAFVAVVVGFDPTANLHKHVFELNRLAVHEMNRWHTLYLVATYLILSNNAVVLSVLTH